MEVAEPVIELAATNKDAALVASEFIDVLQQAATGTDVEAIKSVLDKVPKSCRVHRPS